MTASQPLRIALISMHTTPFADPGQGDVGGMNVVVKHTASELAALGHAVQVYTRRTEPSAPAEEEVAPGVHLFQLDAGHALIATKTKQEDYIEEFAGALRDAAHRATESDAPWDIIHSHHWFSGIAAVDLAAELGIPHVQSFHSIAATDATDEEDPDWTSIDWTEGERPEGPGRVPAEARLSRESSAIIAVSAYEAHTVAELGGSAERIHVVAPGVDHAVFTPGPSIRRGASASPDGRPTLLVAARLEPLKGIDLAIDLLGQIPAAIRPRLEISGARVGGYAEYEDHLHGRVEALGLAGDVEFVGPLERAELARAMREAAAVLVPSFSETFGLVALEASACGTAVVAARAGGLVEAVVDVVTGLLVDGRDPEHWATTVADLLADDARREAMGAAGSRHCVRFTWAATAAGWVRVYRAVLDPAKATA